MTSNGPAIVVRPLRFTDDVTGMQAFCETIGFRPRVESRNGAWFDLVRHDAGRDQPVAAGEGGSVAFRDGAEADAAVVEPVYATAEPLDQLLTRLRDAGHADATLRDEVVYVTDPDGCRTVIHAATQVSG